MKHWCIHCSLSLVILVFIFISLPITPVNAQEGPANFYGFDPSEGLPDTELKLTLMGSGFDVIEDMGINIEDISVSNWQIESEDTIYVLVYIPPDAPPGFKRVEINYQVDRTPFRAVIEDGFEVLEPEPPPVVGSVQLYGVDPQEGSPGTEMDVILRGEGFTPADDFDVSIEGIEVLDREIESNEAIRAHIFIPEDAPPGPHPVNLVLLRYDQPLSAGLEDGFYVWISGLPTSTPPPAPNPPIPWVWPLITVLLSGASFTVGRVLTIRSKLTWKQTAKLQWQVQAQTNLPKPTKACEWACQKKLSLKGGRWKVTRIDLTPLPVKGKSSPKKQLEGNALDPLNELINDISASQEEIKNNLTEVVDKLLAQIMAWENEGQSPASIRLDAKLAGAVDAEFKLYHCHQTPKGLEWGDDLLNWKHKVNQPGGEFLGVLRGPTAGEEDFNTRASAQMEESLLELVRTVRFRF